jgi:hypothetical protein
MPAQRNILLVTTLTLTIFPSDTKDSKRLYFVARAQELSSFDANLSILDGKTWRIYFF